MKPIIEGSSKQFFPHHAGTYLMTFKDALHGASQTGQIAGTGYLRQAFTYNFFRLLEEAGIPTHLTPDPMQDKGIVVKEMEPIKLEILVRNVARGHWVDAHKIPVIEAGALFDPPLVEFCLKYKTTLPNGNELDDPRISPELAIHLNSMAKEASLRNHLLLSLEEAVSLKKMALSINAVYAQLLGGAGWILEDFKFEVGIPKGDPERRFLVIDEISPDSSRIRDKAGNSLTKDLFRQKRPPSEVYQGYLQLKNWVEEAYASNCRSR